MRQMYLKTEEICKAIRQGNDVTENIAQIEPQLKHCKKAALIVQMTAFYTHGMRCMM